MRAKLHLPPLDLSWALKEKTKHQQRHPAAIFCSISPRQSNQSIPPISLCMVTKHMNLTTVSKLATTELNTFLSSMQPYAQKTNNVCACQDDKHIPLTYLCKLFFSFFFFLLHPKTAQYAHKHCNMHTNIAIINHVYI